MERIEEDENGYIESMKNESGVKKVYDKKGISFC